jgi:hypothetical protein
MKPKINSTKFGSISINNVPYRYDVLIRLDGRIEKRKKKLSKAIYGTSHTISLTEAEYIYEPGTEKLIIGAGQFGKVHLSDEAAAFFKEKGCEVEVLRAPKALLAWNDAHGAVVGLFHITC